MDPTSPPRRRALASRAQRHGHLGSDKKSNSKPRLLDKNIGRYPKLTERRSTLADAHLPSYFRFLARELRGRGAGSTGRKFLSEAKRRYKQFCRSGDLDLRRLTWSAIQLCAKELEKEDQL